MGKSRRVLRCYHCGAVLQDKDPNGKGYITKELLESKDIMVRYCNSCYDIMKSFNSSVLDLQIDEDILKILDDAVATDALILWVVDLFAFNGALNPEIAKKVRNNRVIVVGNKIDLLPINPKKNSLSEYLNERFNEFGINPHDIWFSGNANKLETSEVLDKINEARRGHDVYIIGNSTSGKTTLINRMLKFYENKTTREIRTIQYPKTEVKVLEIPLSRSSFVYELPGFSQTTSVASKVEKDVLKYIVPHKPLKVSLRTLFQNDTFLIGSLGSISLMNGKPTTFKFYSADGVETKKILTKNAENAFIENNQRKNVRPVSMRYTNYKDYDIFEYTMENDGLLHDIGIEGLGWVSFKATGQIINVCVPKGTSIKECPSKIR